MTGTMRKIERVSAQPAYKISVMWADGQQMIVDFSDDIKSSGVWRQLADYSLFQEVRVSLGGYSIEWPLPADEDGEPLLDIDSDGLYYLASARQPKRLTE